MKKILISLILTLALILAAAPALASSVASSTTDTGLDVVILVDRSGTMSKTDPDSIALAATKMFADRCTAKNSVAVITYGYDILYESGFYDLSSNGSLDQLRMAVDACTIQDRTEDTNTGLAMRRAYETIEARRAMYPDRHFAVLVLSDGQIDVGDSKSFKAAYPNADENLKQQLIQESQQMGADAAAQFAADGIPVYCLGIYSESTNILGQDMSQWASLTGGQYEVTNDINEVYNLIRQMYLDMTGNPNFVTVTDGTFDIPDNVLEANIEIVPSIGVELMTLADPAGNQIDLTGGDPAVSVRKDTQYTMVKLALPDPGRWLLTFADGVTHDLTVKVTYNLDLNMLLYVPENVVNGDTVDVVLTATKQNVPYYDAAQPAMLSVTCLTNGVSNQVPMAWDANALQYTYTFTPTVVGEYRFSAQIQTSDLVNHATEAVMKTTARPLAKVQDLGDFTFSGRIIGNYPDQVYISDLRNYFSDPDARGIAAYEVTVSEPDYVLASVDAAGALTYRALKATVSPITVSVIARDTLGEPSEPVVGTVTILDGQKPIAVNTAMTGMLAPIEIKSLLPQKEGVTAVTGLMGYFIEENAVDGEMVLSTSARELDGNNNLRVEVVNDNLVLYGQKAGQTEVIITGLSSDGSAAEFSVYVTVENLLVTILMIAGIVLLLILLAVLVILAVVHANKPAYQSTASLTVTLCGDDEYEGSDMLRKYQKRKVKLSEICRKANMLTGQFGDALDKITLTPKKGGVLVQINLKNIHQKSFTLRPYDSRTIDLDPANDLSIRLEYYEAD